MFFVSKSLEDTQKFAETLLNSLEVNTQSAILLGLTGELGAGKTTLTQSIARELGIAGRVTSPTYVILKMYDTSHQVFKKLIHIDAYRLSSGKDLEMLGWSEMIKDSSSLVILEWPEKVADILPSDIVTITIDPINQTTRNIEVTHGKDLR